MTTVLEKLDEAFNDEIFRVSHLPYDSHEICKHFYGELRKTFAASIHQGGEPGWQPIETAPKTSRAILVWCPENKNIHEVSWYEGDWMYFGGSGYLRDAPTHWMPLPATPVVGGGEGV